MKDAWQTSENHMNMLWIHSQDFHGLSFHNALWSNLRSHAEKKPFFEYSSPIFFDLPGKFCNQGVRPVRKSGSTRPSNRSIHIVGAASASSASQCIEWKGSNLVIPLAGFVLSGLANTPWRAAPTPDSEKVLPLFPRRWTGSWFRTFCRNESTSQSTVRAFWAAFMQIVCQCLTGVFSLSVGDRSGLMTSRHSGAAPLGWERMGCYRCRRVPFSNKPGVVGPRLRESNFFAFFGEIAVFAR